MEHKMGDRNSDSRITRNILNDIEHEMSKVVIGQKEIIHGILRAILCNGHVLVEGVPGVAKTLIVRSMAKVLGCDMKRIQFTVDLLPTDITGIVTYNDKPVEATIKVKSKLYKREYTRVKAEETKGDYLVNLPSGNEFEITYSFRDISQTKTLSTALIDSFARIEMNTQLYSEAFIKSKMPKVDSLQIKPEDLSKKGLSYDDFIAKYGDKKVDSLDYRVQIGAYRYIENFNHSILLGLPRVLRKTYHDGITRFTIGEQKTLNEAVALCNKVKKKGIKDAFIIAIYKDERIFFDELLSSGIIEK